MPLLPIRIYGDPVLKEKALPLKKEEINDDFRQFIADMGETMYDAKGVGLAANQVGDLRRVFVVDVDQVVNDENAGSKKSRKFKDVSRRKLQVFINPEILESSEQDDVYNEGCLSIPDVEADVYRPIKVKVRYRNLDWEEKEEWIDGMLARVFQHELDHLNGVLFVEKLGLGRRTLIAGALSRLKKRQKEEATS